MVCLIHTVIGLLMPFNWEVGLGQINRWELGITQLLTGIVKSVLTGTWNWGPPNNMKYIHHYSLGSCVGMAGSAVLYPKCP